MARGLHIKLSESIYHNFIGNTIAYSLHCNLSMLTYTYIKKEKCHKWLRTIKNSSSSILMFKYLVNSSIMQRNAAVLTILCIFLCLTFNYTFPLHREGSNVFIDVYGNRKYLLSVLYNIFLLLEEVNTGA